MKKISVNQSLPKPKSGDILEAAEMLRATLTLMRQAFGIVFMTGSVVSKSFLDDTQQKEFSINFDEVSKTMRKSYSLLIENYQDLKKSEDSEDGRLSS